MEFLLAVIAGCFMLATVHYRGRSIYYNERANYYEKRVKMWEEIGTNQTEKIRHLQKLINKTNHNEQRPE